MMEFERVIFMDNYFICDYWVRVRVCISLNLKESSLWTITLFVTIGLGLGFADD